MKIGGFQQTSLLDYPDCISSVIWTIGCNFRCPFCYNKQLVEGTAVELISEEEILSFLKKRKDLIEGVSITGGEPLIQEDVQEFINKIKDIGYKVKIDTNGYSPRKLEDLLNRKLIDYVAMDVKAPKQKYPNLTNTKVNISDIERSIVIIKEKAPAYEFKTTIIPQLLTKDDIHEIAHWLQGSRLYYLQQFKSAAPLLSSSLESIKPYSKEELQEIIQSIRPFFNECKLRGV